MIRLFTLGFLTAVVLSVSLAAQSPAPETARTFRVFSAVGRFSDLKFDNGPGKTTRIEVVGKPLDEYTVPGKGTLSLYREVPPPPEAPAGSPPRKKVVAQVTIPATQVRTLVVLIPENDGVFRAYALDDGPARHHAGTIRLINLSRLGAAVALSDTPYTLPVGAPELIAPFDGGAILIRVAVQNHNNWVPAFRMEGVARPTLRSYGFIFDFMDDPGVDHGGMPPPALVRLFTEAAAAKP